MNVTAFDNLYLTRDQMKKSNERVHFTNFAFERHEICCTDRVPHLTAMYHF